MQIIKQIGAAGIHYRLKRLSDKINGDVLKIYKENFPEIEPAWFTVLFSISENGACSVQDIATSLGISHPAVIQFIKKIEKADLVHSTSDILDKRKKIISLTPGGTELLEKIKPVHSDIENAYLQLMEDSGLDVPDILEKLETSLSQNSLNNRIRNFRNERIIKQVEILAYNKKFRDYFKELNYEWLNKYFEVEPEDDRILNNPEKEIIKKGGEIFFARIKGEIIGTCAVIQIDQNTYELAKMAVTDKAKGLQAGKKLALAVIGFVWSKKGKYVTLLTNRKLVSAITLYKSLGFETVPGNEESSYKRKVFRMTLEL
ncbi:MAG: bifunctional helix-turn-helix transcriptional regulator/GNAT family N-acetyltransferase [Ignavibacteriaceae bacterium]